MNVARNCYTTARTISRFMIIILAILGVSSSAAFAENSTKQIWRTLFGSASEVKPGTQLTWESLIPASPPLENFLESIPPDQLDALEDIDYWKSFPEDAVGNQLAYQRDEAKKLVDEDRVKFAQKGVSIDALYQEYLDWANEIDRQGRLTVKKLDGKRVTIAGYLLPLDFDSKGTKEFLLVPFVGACIHVPPPPPNQVVFVKSSSPYQITNFFDGVMITGNMRVQSAKRDLSFMDGANDVDSGYLLEGATIEPYEYEDTGQ